MREPDDGDARSTEVTLLYEEQARLRSEIDRLRDEQDQLRKERHSGNGDQRPAEQQPQQEKQAEPQKPRKPPRRKRIAAWAKAHPVKAALIVIAVIALLIGGYFWWEYIHSYQSTDDAEIGGHTDPVSSRVAGRVTAVYVENTQHVVKGQTLVDLDPSDYEVAVEQARANLAQAEAALQAQAPNVPITRTTEQTNVTSAGLDISSAKAALSAAQRNYEAALADVQQAQADETNAAADEARYRTLIKNQEVSQEAYEQKVTNLHALQQEVAARKASAEAAHRAVQQRMDAVQQAQTRASEIKANSTRRVVAERATVGTRRAAVEAAKAQLQQAMLNLSYCKILAPVAGIVGNRTVEVGMQVAPGQGLLSITQINDLWVTANFKETEIGNIHPGESATIHVDALSQDFKGYVENLPGATGSKYSLLPPENATGNYVKVVQRLPVRIRFKPGQPNMDRLRPGMSVEPKVWIK